MQRRWRLLAWVTPPLAWIIGATLSIAAGVDGIADPAGVAVIMLASSPGLALGLLVLFRRPDSAAGPGLMLLVAAPVLVFGVEQWAVSATTADPWWGAELVAAAGVGIWTFNLAGFVALCLTFPAGRLPGRGWASLPWLWLAAAVAVIVVLSGIDGTVAAGRPVSWVLVAAAFAGFLATLVAAVCSLVVRYRHAGELVRLQLRWLIAGAATVPLLLLVGWVAEGLGVPIMFAYAGFVIAMFVLLPAAATVGILRHDLLDLDRLLGGTLAALLTSVLSAAMFAVVVLVAAEARQTTWPSSAGVALAAFVTALLILPIYRWLHVAVGRVVDRERSVTVTGIQRFVRRVRDGDAEPEEVESALRLALDDPGLRLLLRAPGASGYVDLAGAAVRTGLEGSEVPLSAGGEEVAALVVTRPSARRVRLARELAVEARLPIEVSRLRLELRGALEDAQRSRERLAEAGVQERRRLERDLHDGAQQRILAVGMRLRSAQRRFQPDEPTYGDLEAAVLGLEETVIELRRLAHGIRPSGLDDGLEHAVRSLVASSPIPVEVSVADLPMSEAVESTAYFVISEALTNAFKHAAASWVRVRVSPRNGGVEVEVADDGSGGATEAFGLTGVRDRVEALGGRVEVVSPVGAGTSVRAEL